MTLIGVVDIAVVAFFIARDVDVAVAAGLSGETVARAAIARDDIQVVAGFTCIAHAIATALNLAIAAARGVGSVTVVCAGIAAFALFGIDNAVTATRKLAVVATFIIVELVAVVTAFAADCVKLVIAAGFVGRAIRRAAIATRVVTVVTGFGWTDNPVTAIDGDAAPLQTQALPGLRLAAGAIRLVAAGC